MEEGVQRKSTQPDAAAQKAGLRRSMKDKRGELTASNRALLDEQLCEQLLDVVRRLEADSVYCYVSFGTEADTIRFLTELWKRGVRTAVPHVEGRRMSFYWVNGMGDLSSGYLGILEPKPSCCLAEDRHALVVTPGLAFTADGARLGYGGGYYDRFFAEEPDHMRIGAAYAWQVVEELPVEETDHRLHLIVTDQGIHTCGQRKEEDRDGTDGAWSTGEACGSVSE